MGSYSLRSGIQSGCMDGVIPGCELYYGVVMPALQRVRYGLWPSDSPEQLHSCDGGEMLQLVCLIRVMFISDRLLYI